jgi:methylglutamate dehydrogenase subunit D
VFERRSALAGALLLGGRDGPDGQRPLRIGEVRGWSLIQMAAFAATLPDLQDAVRPMLNADLPIRIGVVVNVDGRRLLKTGPNRFWIITRDDDDLTSDLQAAVAPHVGAVTPLSHSRTCISIEGVAAREVLAAGIALDLHPKVFGLGQFALTGVHHTAVLLERSSGENRYDLHVSRTFALSVWEWLTDAALPFGYEIVGSDGA